MNNYILLTDRGYLKCIARNTFTLTTFLGKASIYKSEHGAKKAKVVASSKYKDIRIKKVN